MCGLYSFRKSADETRSLLKYLERPDFPPRNYVTPSGPMAIVRMDQGERHFALVRWVHPHELGDFRLAPNIAEAVARARHLLSL